MTINSIHIGFGTETNNAYDLALLAYLNLEGKVTSVKPIDKHFTFEPNNLYILFVSTTGQGDPPYAMR
jgi:hypothetical protein